MPARAGVAIMEEEDDLDCEVHRTLRVRKGLWLDALDAAGYLGTTVSDELRAALHRLVKRAERARAAEGAGKG